MASRCEDLEAQLAVLRTENAALRQLLGAHEDSLARAGQRLEDTLALLTREQRLVARMQQEAEYDSLTGLPKRSTFESRLQHSLDVAGSNPDYRFAVLSINLDRFQSINESMGHFAGNELLRGVAQRLLSSLRVSDMVGRIESDITVARLVGDEFAILLDNVKTTANATLISDRIQRCLATPFTIDAREVFATASIGVALSAPSYRIAEEIMRDANMARCRAKARGKGRCQVFDSEMRANALVRWELETDLRHAMARNELRAYYQPKMVLATQELAGFEALLRWEHPKRGLISPLQFIPIAEETGLIVEIGNWVLREACRQLREWNDRFVRERPLEVSVNLSCCQFADTSLFNQIAGALLDVGFDPQLLSLEITESNLMGNTEFGIEVLKQLKVLGVGLMIDDFGTGYSSLNHLAKFPFDTLKIDQSFVRSMDTGADGVEMVRTMLALAENLGMKVVAEGIETSGQLERLKALGCSYGQGYFFSKPLTALATEQMLANLPATSRKRPPAANLVRLNAAAAAVIREFADRST